MKKKVISIIFALILIFALRNTCNAASASIACENTAKVGEPIEIVVTVNAVQWKLSLNVNGETIATSNELENVESNKTITFSGKYTPKEAGTLNVTLTGTATEFSNGETVRSFDSKTITVTAPTPVATPTPEIKEPTKASTATPTTEEKKEEVEKTQEQEKSTNKNLKNLGIKPTEYDFTNFKSSRTSYTATVPYEVEDIEVWYEKSDEKATVEVTGGKDLKVGANTITVAVTAENGTTKNYKITVTRQEEKVEAEEIEEQEEIEEEIEEEPETTVATDEGEGLKTLKISGITISPTFKTNVYEYTANLKEDKNSVDIEAETTSEDYTISIAGNENLVDGENLVTIIVYDEKNAPIATYQVTVIKNTINPTEINNIIDEANEKENTKTTILTVIAILVVILIIVYIIISIKNKKALKEFMEDDCILEKEMEKREKIEENIESEKIENKKGKHF